MWVLIVWLVGSTYSTPVEMHDFDDKLACESALAIVKQKAPRSPDGVCVPRASSKQ